MGGIAYAAVWREGDGEIVAGRATADASSLELEGSGLRTTISSDEVVAVRVGREIGERVRGRPAVVLERTTGAALHVAPSAFGVTHELAGHVQRWVDARPRRRPVRVLVAGGGIAAAEAVLALRHDAEERAAITLLSPSTTASYRPLDVLEPFGGGRRTFDLEEVARSCAADFRADALAAVAADEHVATTECGARLEYDALVVATGAATETGVAGSLALGTRGFAARFRRVLEELEADAPLRIVFVVPEGRTWLLPLYELALATAGRTGPRARLTLLTAERAPLAAFGSEASATVTMLLARAGVEVLARTRATRVDGAALELPSGAQLRADCVVAAPRLAGRPIPGLPCDDDGFLSTDPFGHVPGAAHVFAAGDATAFPVKHGGLAAQQADTVAAGVAALAGAPVRPQPFRPVLHGLLLTGGRPLYLRAETHERPSEGAVVSDEALWWPGGKIAARHLAPYLAARATGALHST
jgi:sulfide:quinone oxidoreductase